jgi:hypothetical protein
VAIAREASGDDERAQLRRRLIDASVYVLAVAVILRVGEARAMDMSAQRFAAGQRVNVEIGGKRVQAVFVRAGVQQEGVNVKSAAAPPGEGAAGIAWVRRSDTGEVEPFELRLISAA